MEFKISQLLQWILTEPSSFIEKNYEVLDQLGLEPEVLDEDDDYENAVQAFIQGGKHKQLNNTEKQLLYLPPKEKKRFLTTRKKHRDKFKS